MFFVRLRIEVDAPGILAIIRPWRPKSKKERERERERARERERERMATGHLVSSLLCQLAQVTSRLVIGPLVTRLFGLW